MMELAIIKVTMNRRFLKISGRGRLKNKKKNIVQTSKRESLIGIIKSLNYKLISWSRLIDRLVLKTMS